MKWILLYVFGIVGLDVHYSLAQSQTKPQYDTPAPSSINPTLDFYTLPDQDVRQRILTDAWHAAEAAKSHVEELSQRIQTLKRQPLSDPVEIQELEQQRLLLLRQHMVAQQFRTTPDRSKTEL